MDEEQQTLRLAEDLVTTCARIIRWIPTDDVPLSLAGARLLARLQESGPTRVGDLAAAERSSQPTITNHVNRLEAHGLVARMPDPTDRRAWMVELTKLGSDQLALARLTLAGNLEPTLARLSSADRAALADGVEAMRKLMAL